MPPCWTSTMIRCVRRAVLVSCVVLFVGCHADNKAEEIEHLDGPTGRLAGAVSFAYDRVPSPTAVTNHKDATACGTTVRKLDLMVSHESRGIANVLVWVDGIELPVGYRPPARDLRMATQRCQFSPRVSAVTVGST